jgi:lipoyl-dependent peroxiredoxin
MKTLYTAKVKVQGGREGHAQSNDDILNLKLAPPKELGGPGGATNPEQLFAAGYAACFESAIRHVARQQKLNITQSSVTAEVTLGSLPTGAFKLAVDLNIELPTVARDVGLKLVEQAHQVCPYSSATRGNIEVNLTLA